MLGKRRGGLIHHQNFRVFPCDLCDLHKFPSLEVQRTQRKFAPDVLDAKVFQHLIRRRIQRLAVNRTQLSAEWLNLAQKQVFRHRNAGNSAAFLNDHSDAVL